MSYSSIVYTDKRDFFYYSNLAPIRFNAKIVLDARIHCFFITYRFNLVLLSAFRRSAVFNQLCLRASAAVILFLYTEIILNCK